MDLNTFKQPSVISGFVSGIVLFLVMLFPLSQNWILSAIVAFLFGGFVYLIYNDYEQKKQLRLVEEQKEQARLESIRKQRETDKEKTVCVSCNSPITNVDEPCPKCGFKLSSISIDE